MTALTSGELSKIAAAGELQIASLRRDGMLRNPVTIWVVRLGDDLCVRSVNEPARAPGSAAPGGTGRPHPAGGISKDVTFADAGSDLNDQAGIAYRANYHSHAASIISAGTDAAESIRTIHRALELGVTFIDTAETYGPFTNEELAGRAIKGHRDEAVLATKFGRV